MVMEQQTVLINIITKTQADVTMGLMIDGTFMKNLGLLHGLR